MNILLTAINAKYIHSNPAVYSLRAYACRYGGSRYEEEIRIAEYTINQPVDEILMDIYERCPDILCISCYLWNISYVEQLIREIPKVLPETEIWLGGPEVSYNAREMLDRYPGLAGVMCGEGEQTFLDMLETYAVGNEPEEILTAREALDLSSIPFIYEHIEDFDNRIVYYESSRGCPFSCSYCLSSIDKSVRFRDAEKVCRELQFFLNRRVPQVKFVDRTFNCRKSHAMAIWTYILEHDNGITNFHFEIEAELLDAEELELLGRMRPGLVQLEIGVQSANPKTLEAVRRKTDLDKLEKIVGQIRSGRNIHQHLDLIAGLPFEDYESFGHSFDRVFAMKPEQLQLGFLKVLKGAPMQEDARKYGLQWRFQPPYEVLSTPWLPFSDILRLKMIEEMVEIYYNSLQFGKTLEQLIPRFSSAFAFFENLAVYYGERQSGQKSSRVRKYELLLDFAAEYFPEEKDRYRELLTVDYYLRERAKARPSFAPDETPYKEELRRIRRLAPGETHVEALTGEGAALLRGEKAEAGKNRGPVYLIFDYEKRSPLTGDAGLSWWEEEPKR